MKKLLDLLSSLCASFVGTFDACLRAMFSLTMDLANVAIRVLIALGIYKIVFEDWLLPVLQAL